MPNWCSTSIIITHEDSQKLRDFKARLDEWMSKNYMKNDFGLAWLGNIIGNSGIGTINQHPKTDLYYRGYVEEIVLDENQLIISTETAWQPILLVWIKLLSVFLPNAELTYVAEESGFELYCTNDSSLVNTYCIYSLLNDINIESCDSCTQQELISILQYLLKTSETDIEHLLQMLDESIYSNSLFIHKWEYKEPIEW